MVFRSCCNICSTRTFPENGRSHHPSHGTHGIPWRSTWTWTWPSLRGEGGCPGTRPGRMGTWNSEGVPYQREAQGDCSWGEDFHHQLRYGDLVQIMQLPSLTSPSRWRKLPATACATWRGGRGSTPTSSPPRSRLYLMPTVRRRSTTLRWCWHKHSARDLFAVYSKNKLSLGSTTRRWCTARGSPGRQETSPSCGQICCCYCCCCLLM